MTAPGTPAAGEAFVPVTGATAADVAEGQVVQAKHANGTALCVGRHQGALFAVKDSCPHAEFPLSDSIRHRLLNGLDDIGVTLTHADDIAGYETTRPAWLPTTA